LTTGDVLQFQATAEYTLQEQEGSLDIEFRVLRLEDPAVERPEWVAEALEQAAQQS
jgi:hypothetical protein